MLEEGRHSPFFRREIGWDSLPPDYFHEVLDSLAQPPFPDPKREIGRILISAIAYGAFLNREAWDQFAVTVAKCRLVGDLPTVEMAIQCPRSPTGLKPWRWYADPVTRALIDRWHRHVSGQRRTTQASAEECLTAFLTNLDYAPEDTSRAIDCLLSWATHEARLRMPALLVDQARGALPTVDLPTYHYRRLCGDEETTAQDIAKEVARPQSPRKSAPPNAYQATREWRAQFAKTYPSLCSAFIQPMEDWRTGRLGHGQIKVQCIANLEAEATGAPKSLRRILAWCQALLETDRSPYPRGFSPFTVRLRLLGLLMGVFRGELPTSLEAVSRRKILIRAQSAIREESCRTRKALIRQAALDFVYFDEDRSPLGLDPDVEEREESWAEDLVEIEHLEQQLGKLSDDERQTLVSANLVSSTEYRDIINAAYKQRNGDELALIIMLGFRTGMRLPEILGLQTCDILHRGKFLELHLQTNSRRPLKTFRSRRIFPLDLLLNDNERHALLKWLKPRTELARARRKPLLVFGPLSAIAMPDERTYDSKVTDVLWRARHERTLRFSHLRHSFGSYLLLTLLIPSSESVRLVPSSFRAQVTWKRKWELLPSLIGKDRLGQSALHAVSQMMGHTGILRTLESYQHLLSLAVGLYVNRQIALPHLPGDAIQALGLEELEWPGGAQHFGDSQFWAKVSSRLVQLPSFYDELSPFEEAKGDGSGVGDWARSPVFARTPGASSDNSSKVSWRLFLTLVSADQDTSETEASKHDIDLRQVTVWRARYRQVVSSAFAPGTLPDGLKGPRGTNAQTVVDKVWSKLPESLTDRQIFLLQAFLSGFRSRRYHSVFSKLTDAIEFADFLRSVGFSGDHLFIAAGPADLIQGYKTDPLTHLKPQQTDAGMTRYRSPEDLFDRAAESHEDGSPVHPVVSWFRHMKFEADALGLHYDRRYRLDKYNDRLDAQILASGLKLSEPRQRAAEKRRQRAEALSKRTKSTVFADGNKAYRFSLLLAAVYFDIELAVEYPQTPHSENLKKRERRLAAERAQ